MQTPFYKSVTKYKSIYFHFLDGLINSIVGNEIINSINTIINFNLIEKKNYSNIYFLTTSIIQDDTNSYILEFNTIDNDRKNYISFIFDYKNPCQIYEKDDLCNLKNCLSYCIFLTEFNSHLSSSILFIKDYKLYFYILNSGDGIEHNGQGLEFKNQQFSSNNIHFGMLSKGIMLCDNINNDDAFFEGINKLKDILFISFFYNFLQMPDILFPINEYSEGSQVDESEGSQRAESEGSQRTESEGSQGYGVEGSQRTESEGSQRTESEGSQGYGVEGSQRAESEGSQGYGVEGSQRAESEGSQGYGVEGSQGDESEGSQGYGVEGSQGDESEGSQGDESEGSQVDESEGSQGDDTNNPQNSNPKININLEYFLIYMNGIAGNQDYYYLDDELNYDDLNIDEIKHLDYNNYSQYNKGFKLYKKYYHIIADYIDNQGGLISINLHINNIDEYDKETIFEELKRDTKFDNIFILKITLFFQNGQTYIIDQESGSCSWFAYYFSIIFYLIIFENCQSYINFIKNINTRFSDYLVKLFTYENFKEELKIINSSNFIYMKKLCSKLIDFGIIDKEILFNIQDLIYDTEFTINLKRKNIFYHRAYLFDEKDTYKNYIYTENLTSNVMPYSRKIDWINYNWVIQNAVDFYKDSYDIYIKEYSGYLVFKNITDINKDSIKRNINRNFKQSEKENILHLVDIFFQTYNYDICDKCPSYLFNFIPIILYINYIKRINDGYHIILDLEDNKDELFSCCIIFLRLYIINEIILEINNIGNKDKKDRLINLIIKPLLQDEQYWQITLYEKIDFEFKMFSEKIISKNNIYESFDIIIDDYINYENYVYDNPKYINSFFIICNLERIYNKPIIKEKLIRFFASKYYLEFNMENKESDICLFTLLYNYPPHISNGWDKKNIILLKYVDSFFYRKFFKILDKKINNENLDNFIEYVNRERSNILDYNLFNLIPNYDENKNIIYDKETCLEYEVKNYVFTHINSCVIFSSNEEILISNIDDKNKFFIYSIYESNIIQYNCNQIYRDENQLIFKINKIFFNENKIIQYNKIFYPFKYMIPITGNNFIYKINKIFKVSFITNKNNDIIDHENDLLGKNVTKKKIYTFEINPNTQFYLKNLNNINDIVDWHDLCIDYQINKYNILYIDLANNSQNYNINNTGYSFTPKYMRIFDFDKNFKKQISYKKININLFYKSREDPINFKFSIEGIVNTTKSLNKLLFKISECKISNNCKFEYMLLDYKKRLIDFFIKTIENFKNFNLNYFLDKEYHFLYYYLIAIKIYNLINKIIKNFDNQKFICLLIKNNKFLFDIMKESFTYKFELLFELLSGNLILEEQFQRYNEMITSYKNYLESQKAVSDGGADIKIFNVETTPENLLDHDKKIIEKCECEYNYPLHHFMMGKGKSSIITPLLTLYFNIIHKIKVYIIVPKHLVKQTKGTLDYYNFIFNLDIEVISGDDIKYKFLIEDIKKKSIFLIDEFDSLINPLKSNYNLITSKNIEINNIGIIIKNFIKQIIDKLINKIDISKCEIDILLYDIELKNKHILIANILLFINQIYSNKLKYNINWGIDKENLYAIPYRNKDNPLENSSFSSVILTLFLTYYYYFIINKENIDKNILNFIKKNKYYESILNLKIEEFELTFDLIKDKYTNNIIYKELIFEKIELKIFDNLKLSSEQYNTSFIDIINIDNIFKIGYSGTTYINFPILYSKYTFSKKCLYGDEDETTNVNYAIISSEINKINIDNDFDYNILINYDALIDICGYFYSKSNSDLAIDINKILKRDIIFIDENDNINIVINNEIIKYDENSKYNNPFFYYDQSHTIGIDIKQDNYPILNGLCIVDIHSKYTEVAQAIYRLRQLNIGHFVSFILYNFNFEVQNSEELLEFFKKNQEDQLKIEEKNLNLQSLKSDFRKNQPGTIIQTHKERIFNYFQDELYFDPLQMIFTNLDISTIDTCKYHLDINDINEIFFEGDFNDIQSQQEVKNKYEAKIETELKIDFLKKDDLFLYNFTNFKNYDFIKNINSHNFNDFTFKIDEHISFLPNIFKDNVDNIFSINNYDEIQSKTDFIFIYFPFNKLLLAPRHIIPYIYNDYALLEKNLLIINKFELVENDNLKFLKDNNIFIKILNNNYNDCELQSFLSNDENIIYIIILIFLINLSLFNSNKIYDYYIQNTEKITSFLSDYFNTSINRTVICNLEPHLRQNIILQSSNHANSFLNKYLKYKNKYIKLKNKIFL